MKDREKTAHFGIVLSDFCLFFDFIEGMIGRELPLKVKYGIQSVGFILIISLFVLVLYNDINHLM